MIIGGKFKVMNIGELGYAQVRFKGFQNKFHLVLQNKNIYDIVPKKYNFVKTNNMVYAIIREKILFKR